MNKKRILFFVLLIIFTGFLFAESGVDDSNGLKTVLSTIVNVIGSVYVKILALASLTLICLKLICSQDKKTFLKHCYGWIIACLLVNFTPSIISNVFDITTSVKQMQTFSLFNLPSFSETSKKNKNK